VTPCSIEAIIRVICATIIGVGGIFIVFYYGFKVYVHFTDSLDEEGTPSKDDLLCTPEGEWHQGCGRGMTEAEKQALEVMPWWPLKPPEGKWTPGCGRERTRGEWRDVHSAENYDD